MRVLFSGHMVDAPDRAQPRFPSHNVPAARTAIHRAISEIKNPTAQAISGAACGGDLLFCEEWLSTDRHLTIYLPREVESFLDESVRFAGAHWEDTFHQVVIADGVRVVGPEPGMEDLADPHSPNNLRMISAALEDGDVAAVVLWDGGGGDGPGGTAHMVREVQNSGGLVVVIDPHDLDAG